MTLFTKIINKEIPAEIVHEDDQCLAFRDINPQAPTHILLIPKREIASVAEVKPEDEAVLGYLIRKASEIARSEGIESNGYRLVINTHRDAGQTVAHLHIHILGGRTMSWPLG